jgi:hypothetical protein
MSQEGPFDETIFIVPDRYYLEAVDNVCPSSSGALAEPLPSPWVLVTVEKRRVLGDTVTNRC